MTINFNLYFFRAAFIFLYVVAAPLAWGESRVIEADFDGDGKIDKATYSYGNSDIHLDYYSSKIKRTKKYEILKIDECSSMQLYKLKNEPQLVVDGSCSGQGGQIYLYIYAWNSSIDEWCLKREITGENADLPSGKIFPSESVSRVTACSRIGEYGNFSYVAKSDINSEIDKRLSVVGNFKINENLRREFIGNLTDIDVIEIANHLENKNVQAANDLAFYMLDSARYYSAGQLLYQIVTSYPDRVVAKLNLADAYWNIEGAKDLAKKMYKEYAEQMKRLGKSSKIPNRVSERSK